MATLSVADVKKIRDALRSIEEVLDRNEAASERTTPANPGPMPEDPAEMIAWRFAQAPDVMIPAYNSPIPQYSYAPFGQQPNPSFAPRNILSVDRLPKTSRFGRPFGYRPSSTAAQGGEDESDGGFDIDAEDPPVPFFPKIATKTADGEDEDEDEQEEEEADEEEADEEEADKEEEKEEELWSDGADDTLVKASDLGVDGSGFKQSEPAKEGGAETENEKSST